ncbi:MAG: hypothetical protein BWY43_00765 [candidate division WS2 bacterium ADurb.Bin280]|uniref:Uncharacterized protein n=1 Tax=candidate division WS2 bacterium ADurb.Bin280 TaxID=1852829 RepID=A0A1V5SBN1_9BACT|nr:MAG: hypothetical protein BWY43_00765 [candidate division WS2 bacterium ADurb.Bin280]
MVSPFVIIEAPAAVVAAKVDNRLSFQKPLLLSRDTPPDETVTFVFSPKLKPSSPEISELSGLAPI